MYVIAQRALRWRYESQLLSLESYKAQLESSVDGNWHNVRKYSSKSKVFEKKDHRVIQQSGNFVSEKIEKIEDLLPILNRGRNSLFNENHKVIAWKANELLFFDNQIARAEKVKNMMSSVKSSLKTTLNSLERIYPQAALTPVDKNRARLKRKSEKRTEKEKAQRVIESAKRCIAILCKNADEHITKITNGERSFALEEGDLLKSNVHKLNYKLHYRGLQWLKENTLLAEFDGSKKIIEELMSKLISDKNAGSVTNPKKKIQNESKASEKKKR